MSELVENTETRSVTLMNRDSPTHSTIALRRVMLLGLVSWIGYLGLLVSSSAFGFGEPATTRPVLWFVGVMGVLFGLQILATRIAVGCPDQTAIWRVSLIFAVGFRLLILFSEPIQELDYYRYLWDGNCVAAGVSPYRYSPAEVQRASAIDEGLSADLCRLAARRDADPELATILSRIHFEDLPTIYPPVSQAVFAASAWMTPRRASVATRIVVLKAWIVAFDVGTLLILGALLRQVRCPVGWAMIYGWSPLVVKEFANSGHLDAIAVFFCLLAVYALIRGTYQSVEKRSLDTSSERQPIGNGRTGRPSYASSTGRYPASEARSQGRNLLPARWLGISSIGLSLAIGAKLYPVILVPLFGLTVWHRFGARKAMQIGVVTALLSAAFCLPMFDRVPARPQSESALTSSEASTTELPPDRPAVSSAESLRVFLTQWKMNDLLFLIVESNIDPKRAPSQTDPWFAVTSRTSRQHFVEAWSQRLGVDRSLFPFLMTRSLLTLLFLALAFRWAVVGARSISPLAWLRCAFLTLAWFWLLSPTLNPWYWIWALPLVPFAGRRAWIAVAGLLPLYYLRFWFSYHWPTSHVAGTPYIGPEFFDLVVVWMEHGPWLAWLLWESWKSSVECSASQTTPAIDSIITPVDSVPRRMS